MLPPHCGFPPNKAPKFSPSSTGIYSLQKLKSSFFYWKASLPYLELSQLLIIPGFCIPSQSQPEQRTRPIIVPLKLLPSDTYLLGNTKSSLDGLNVS